MKNDGAKQARRARNQAVHYATVLRELVGDTFRSARPADRILAAFLRENRKYGSSDRRFLSTVFFAVFRWWGWLRQMSRPGMTEWSGDADGPDGKTWVGMLAAADFLERGEVSPVGAVWAAEAGTRYAPVAGEERGTPGTLGAVLASQVDGFDPDPRRLAPDWIWAELPDSGWSVAELVAVWQRRPPMWLRVQRGDRAELERELRAAGLQPEPAMHLPQAVKLVDPRVNLYQLEAFRAGRFEVQDFASQCIGLACRAAPGQRWWDACAGAGGKSLQLAAMMEGRGTVVATDIRGWKLKDLKKRARRAGLHNIDPRPWDGKRIPGRNASFDGVLVDAPCSCTGTWRRNPDARWTTAPQSVTEVAATQLAILNRASKAVKAGGRLVYATCSLCKTENEKVAERFAESAPDFAPEPHIHPVNELAATMQRIWPEQADSDATFTACFRRR